MEKKEESRIQSASVSGGMKIVDPPYFPDKPEDNKTKLYLSFSFILALVLGTGCSLVLEVFDDTIKSEVSYS